MTTICFDGKTLATDSRSVCGNTIVSERVQKLWQVGPHEWIAAAGGYQDAIAAVNWFQCGCPPNDKPAIDGSLTMLLLRNRVLYHCESNLMPFRLNGGKSAEGSGAPFALAAMAMGATAAQAVRVAAKYDTGTNSRVQVSK